VPRDDAQGEDPAEPADGSADCFFETAVVVSLDQVGDDLGVGLRLELVPFGGKLAPELEVVLDDAVVDDHHVAARAAVRMGVFFRGPAVSRPARMADAEQPVGGLDAEDLLEIVQLAFGPADVQAPLAVDHGQACRVIAAILQALQSVEQERYGFSFAQIADNSTHDSSSVEELDAEVFDDGVRQHLPRHLLYSLCRLEPVRLRGDSDFKVFALAHIGDLAVAHSSKSRADRLPLRIEHRFLE